MTNNGFLYDTVPGVSALNRTPQFDPKKYLKRIVSTATGEAACDIELKYKKLWFRVVYPQGRIVPTALQITDRLAVVECRVFFGKDDEKPASGHIATAEKAVHGAQYVQMAQYTAENEALSAAGFGCQWSDVRPDPYAALVTATDVPAVPETVPETVTETVTDTVEAVPAESVYTESAPAETAAQTEQPETEPEPEPATATAFRFTPDMPVDTILEEMTREEAEAVVVDIGTCTGWTLAEVLEKRPVSLRWYATGYNGDNNMLRAGARLLLAESGSEEQAA